MTSLPCPPAQWPRFSALLDAAIDLPETERAEWLGALSAEDAPLRPWLERVLASAAGAATTGFLDSPGLVAADEAFVSGDRVGPYRLEAPLGQGGMGEVWRASRQDDGPRREVALKLLHAELLAGPFRQRFARERDVLGALSHPHIANIYDAGVSADGRPYLALELVDGQPITQACRDEAAGLSRRVEFVREVLDALSYAHQRLIVHRDIKPSNVLVTPEGGTKLLDFGIAKLLQPTETIDLLMTQAASRMATPAYAAPEQLSGGAITVATDIFSVGVVLFELCTGHRPFVTAPIGSGAEEAPLASQRADATTGGLPEGARLARRLRGDMDAILARALALDPMQRYGSAEAFARDLLRWLQGLPVSARRIGWPSRAQKFVRRNKMGVALAAVLALALLGGTAGVAWQAQRAERQALRATAIKYFLISLFEQGDPRINQGKPSPNRTAKDLLDAGAEQVDTKFAHDPLTEMELLEALGNIFDILADQKRAEAVRSRKLELARALYGTDDRRVMRDTVDLAYSETMFLDAQAALALLETTRDAALHRHGQESLERAEWLFAHMTALRSVSGGLSQALADGTESVRIFAAHYADAEDYPTALQVLSGVQYEAEQYNAALATMERGRRVEVANGDFDPMDDIFVESGRGKYLARMGRQAEAEATFRHAESQAERQAGRQSRWYRAIRAYHAQMLHLNGNRAEADSMFAEILPRAPGTIVVSNDDVLERRAYGMALASEGRAAAAVPVLEAVLAEDRRHSEDEALPRRTEGALGDAYDALGRKAEAEVLLRAARDDWMRYGFPNSAQTLQARERWGRFLLDHGDTAAAADEFRAILQQSHGAASAPAALAAAGLARLAVAAGQPGEADTQSARAVRLLAATTLEYDVRARVEVWLARAETLLAAGRRAEAADWAPKAEAAAQEYDAPESLQLAKARELLQKVE